VPRAVTDHGRFAGLFAFGADGNPIMTQLTPTITTAATTLNKAYRKIQGGLLKGFQNMSEEWDLFDEIPDYDITKSAREMTAPVDLNPAGRSAYIPEGGLEDNPTTPPLEEVTLTWANLNERFLSTLTARYLDQKSQAGMIIRQLRYQAMKALETISNTVAWDFYGFSTGQACQTTTVATQASGTYTLANAFGVSGLGTAAYLGSMFTTNDRVALIRAGALVANAIGQITAVDLTNGTITVTWLGSVTSASGDNVVFANSVENTTIAGTDWNMKPVGLLDASTSTSVHGLSGSSVGNWNVGLASTTAGRFSGLKLRKAKQAIQNLGNGKPDLVIWANGVENDTIEAERALARFSSTFGMELDGDVKSKGIEFFTSRKVPPGFVWVMDRDAMGKYTLLPKPTAGAPAWNDGDKMENRNALQFSIDFPYAYVWKNRRMIAYFQNQTEQ
jgi:hypothetical protein